MHRLTRGECVGSHLIVFFFCTSYCGTICVEVSSDQCMGGRLVLLGDGMHGTVVRTCENQSWHKSAFRPCFVVWYHKVEY
jgi:hypothetical protein